MLTSEELAKSIMEQKGKYIITQFRKFRQNSIWILNQREKLREKYPDMYIAVRSKEIIASHKDLTKLILKINEIPNNEDIVIDFISSKKLKLLL